LADRGDIKFMIVAYVFYSFNTGGAELLAIDVLNNLLCRRKHLVVINDTYDSDLLKLLNEDVKITLLNRKSGSRSLRHVVLLNALLFLNRVNIVHCHNESIGVLVSGLFKKVVTVHDVERDLRYLKNFDSIIAISDAVKLDIEKRSNFRAHKILNAISSDKIVERSHQRTMRRVEIICPARLEHEKKGQDLLISAIERLVDCFPNIYVTFVGEGESAQYLEHLIEEKALSEYFCFLGNKRRDWIYNNLQYYSLMILPSRYEGFGLVVVEALCAGLPVIVPNIDGPMEIIENGRYGLSFEANSHEDLANVIAFWINNCKDTLLESKVNTKEIRERYSIGKHVDELLDLYSRVC